MFAGNSLLVVGFVIAMLAAIMLALRGVRQKRYLALLCPVVVLANPLQQPIFLESLDTHINQIMLDNVAELQIIGKTPDEVRQHLGNAREHGPHAPRMLDRSGTVTWEGETYTVWEYPALSFYWFGSTIRVVFVDGKVRSFRGK